jgi:hypothetical protein
MEDPDSEEREVAIMTKLADGEKSIPAKSLCRYFKTFTEPGIDYANL